MHLLFVCAFTPEARGLIDFYGLRRVADSGWWESDSVSLALSGPGMMAAAGCAEALIARRPDALLCNIGVAGSGDVKMGVGSLYFIRRVYGPEGEPVWDSDVAYAHSFEERPLRTYAEPQQAGESRERGLCDMEAAGVLETAHRRLGAGRTVCFKVVSDHLETRIPSKGFVMDLMRPHIRPVAEWLDGYRGFLKSS